MKKLIPAFLAVLLLAACTVPSAEVTPTPEPTPTEIVTPTPEPVPTGTPVPGALTAEELQWFEEVFFRSSYDNIRNVFGCVHYGRPQDIDLYDLFYDGSHLGELTEATSVEVEAAYPDQRLDCPVYRVTCGEMNEVLLKYTGLTLEETNQVGLDQLPYLEEYDAYYWMHGDVGYPGPLDILSGIREGSTVKLYQRYNGTLYCLTLEQQPEGNYWFVSNIPVSEDTLSEFDTDAAREMEEIYGQITKDDQFTMTLILDGAMAGSYPAGGWNRWDSITEPWTGYVWDYALEPVLSWDIPENTDQLIFSREEQSLTFYNFDGWVEYREGETSRWYRAYQSVNDWYATDIYHEQRYWFDETELENLRSLQGDIAISDDGRSIDEIARAWVEAYEGINLRASPGSKMRWTYMKVVRAEKSEDNIPAFEDLDENTVPIVWNTVFVPEINNGNNFWAGNTDYYTGDDPEVPQGALQWWRVGYLHRGEDGLWRCDGGGTGW